MPLDVFNEILLVKVLTLSKPVGPASQVLENKLDHLVVALLSFDDGLLYDLKLRTGHVGGSELLELHAVLFFDESNHGLSAAFKEPRDIPKRRPVAHEHLELLFIENLLWATALIFLVFDLRQLSPPSL